MKDWFSKKIIFTIIFVSLVLISCNVLLDTTTTTTSISLSTMTTNMPDTITTSTSLGNQTTTTTVAVSPSFAMVDVPTKGITFTFNDIKPITLTPFKMGNTEVPYSLWYTVREWAVSNGYIFANEGCDGQIFCGSPTAENYKPVQNISWRDCIVWCNAYSEKSGLTPVYYTDSGYTMPLRTSTNNSSVDTKEGSEDNPYVNWSANGYRLPTEAEWEYAARYKDGTNWTPYKYASGAVNLDEISTGEVAWYINNAGGVTHDVGMKRPNALGLYDMSGNVSEWCWDWYGTLESSPEEDPKGATSGFDRLHRGSSWSYYCNYGYGFVCDVGGRYDDFPCGAINYCGFRLVQR